ncbi:phosphoribosylamine--glycine ligase [Clostridium sp. D2Q-11]|uniref:Phosphoribosylamine--glycine ligase n=1 Tax=Anaeromonas frigoriresistens TaxID=2683708 RepID=A0A942UUM9_9FIRM|nr:phosphoribosylamine--glycine ligase [Anaeromonas frigoriresistens]MBS4538903.1 phosphoribosylamine--glycine ligase [Anaeromonas frigoriresistens]
MNVLVIGSGGREHALIWKLSQSPKINTIYSIPGNSGISEIAKISDIDLSDTEKIIDFVKNNNIELTIVGPEQPLVNGIVDRFNEENLKVFGPNKKASLLEGSKVFSKNFMIKYNIPTAAYKEVKNYQKALEYIEDLNTFHYPLVLKADGLAAGKGVIIAKNKIEAVHGLDSIMKDKIFGDSGNKIIIEEYLDGIEASVLCLCDGNTITPLESVKDYKKAYDNDLGPNTGGMGTYSPNKYYTEEISMKVKSTILDNIIKGFKKEEIEYKGILFIGIMIVEGVPKVLEFNVRFGDPETQALMPRLKTDIVDIIDSVLEGNLDKQDIEWSNKSSICVILASEGYPLKYEKYKEIKGLNSLDNSIGFHSGTINKNGKTYTNGGRVIGITGLGDNIEDAIEIVYKDLEKIKYKGKQYRKDIGR